MADIAGGVVGTVVEEMYSETKHRTILGYIVELGSVAPSSFSFKMRGRDDGRTPGNDYITWIHSGSEPDSAGTGFASGSPTPIGNLISGSVIQISKI